MMRFDTYMFVFIYLCFAILPLSSSSVVQIVHEHENIQPHNLNVESGRKPGSIMLTIVNDGPTILGANTTYYATVSSLPNPGAKYICYWSELKCGKLMPTWSTTELISNKCNTTSRYNCTQNLGDHTMLLRILHKGSMKEIATSISTVEITEYMNVKLSVQQDGTVCNTTDKCLVTTKKSVQMTVDIHDPSNFFKDAFIEYDWLYGDGNSELSVEPMVLYNYSTPGSYEVQVNLTAFLQDEERTEKSGYLTYYIDLLDAVSNLTITGSSKTTVGSVGQYNVSCNGSVPVSFCWSMVHHTQDNSTIDNDTCIWTVSSPFCNDTFKYRFNTTGTYHLRVKAINDVSLLISETSIDVKLAPVVAASITAGLVFGILIGIIFSIVSITIVVQSYRKDRMRHVEVANFDFQRNETNESSLSNFARRLRTMVTPPPSSREEQLYLFGQKPNVARELDVL
ncbi:uncharacterized protein [Amphiura filiformis]|uniref:uncharacterized protein n=1 Tax=Amphiura filiformis TaxID=82378 RepID=UPI003B2233E5